MGLAIIKNGIYLAFGAVVLGLLLHGWRRRKQRFLARMDRDLQLPEQLDPLQEPVDDGFYCIMLKDGTCKSGWHEKSGSAKDELPVR